MRARTIFVLCSMVSMGCTALIGVRDLSYDENAPNGSADGGGTSSSGSSGTSSSGGTGDGGPDGEIVCNADLQTSKDHCGRCGHSCGGGECNAGKCQPLQIGAVANAPLNYVEVSNDYVFVAPLIELSTQVGGIWRIPKAGGAPVQFTTLRYAENMRVLGDKLYFVVEDDPGDGGTGQSGGLYVCGVNDAPPCNPTRIAGADNPAGIAVDGTRIVFTDKAVGMRSLDTTNGQITTVTDKTGRYLFADGTSYFYNFTYFGSGDSTARTLEAWPDGGAEVRHEYTNKNAGAGVLIGTKDAVYIAAYDWEGALTGGFVHRYPRTANGLPCDYGGATNKRPYGVTVDAQRIYWTNMGVGAAQPFTGGSIATCELAGCCTMPETLWTGDGEPGAITTDAAFVYWVLGSGGVWKIAKP